MTLKEDVDENGKKTRNKNSVLLEHSCCLSYIQCNQLPVFAERFIGGTRGQGHRLSCVDHAPSLFFPILVVWTRVQRYVHEEVASFRRLPSVRGFVASARQPAELQQGIVEQTSVRHDRRVAFQRSPVETGTIQR